MKRLHINVSKPYDVLVGSGLLDKLPELIPPVCDSKHLAIITDDVVFSLYGASLQVKLEANGFDVCQFVFRHGEHSKNIATLSDALEFLASNRICRNDALIALGGGVVGDIAGFVAAIYMRGIQVIQVPTTLLAMVDSSVGGKTAVNLEGGKNLAGAFWQPSLVVCDTSIITSLPKNIYSEGMGEVIKYGVISETDILDMAANGKVETQLTSVVASCIALKRDIVERDEFDQMGIRNVLNAGHTVAHAIEKLSHYTIPHGKAVGIGLIVEASIAENSGFCKTSFLPQLIKAVKRYGLFCNIPWKAEELTNAMIADKKNKNGKVVMELAERLGVCHDVTFTIQETQKHIEKIDLDIF